MWTKLFPVSNMQIIVYNLTLIGKLDYIFDILERRSKMGLQREEKFCELIVQAFIEAVKTRQLFIAIQIFNKFAFVLEGHCYEVNANLVK